MHKPLINILTRTSNRPNGFKLTRNSIEMQTYKNINHIISYDNEDDLNYLNQYSNLTLVKIDKNELIKSDNSKTPNTGKYSPHNLYFNEMVKYVNDGWVLYIDDDDYFKDEYSIEKIVNEISKSDDDTLIFWQFRLGDNLILPKDLSKDNPPKLYSIGGETICFNYKYKDIVIWDGWKCSDFRIIDKLFNNVPKFRFINEVLVIAPKPGLGNKIDVNV